MLEQTLSSIECWSKHVTCRWRLSAIAHKDKYKWSMMLGVTSKEHLCITDGRKCHGKIVSERPATEDSSTGSCKSETSVTERPVTERPVTEVPASEKWNNQIRGGKSVSEEYISGKFPAGTYAAEDSVILVYLDNYTTEKSLSEHCNGISCNEQLCISIWRKKSM